MSRHSELFVVCDIGDFSWMVRGDLVNGPLTITLGTLKLATHWDGRGREIKTLTRKRVLRERVVDRDKLWYICYRGREGSRLHPLPSHHQLGRLSMRKSTFSLDNIRNRLKPHLPPHPQTHKQKMPTEMRRFFHLFKLTLSSSSTPCINSAHSICQCPYKLFISRPSPLSVLPHLCHIL